MQKSIGLTQVLSLLYASTLKKKSLGQLHQTGCYDALLLNIDQQNKTLYRINPISNE